MFYNYFNKFITGLGLNRAVSKEGETLPPAPHDMPRKAKEGVSSSKREFEEETEKILTGEVIAAAGGSTVDYKIRMEEEKLKDQKILANLQKENEERKKPKEIGALRTSRETVAPQVKLEEPLKGAPKPTPAEEAIAEAVKIIGAEDAQKELASLLGEKPYGEAPSTPDQEWAMITGTEKKEEMPGSGLAAPAQDKEFIAAAEYAKVTAENNNVYELALLNMMKQFGEKDYSLNDFAKNLKDVSFQVSTYISRYHGKLDDKFVEEMTKGKTGQALEDAKNIAMFARGLQVTSGAGSDKISQSLYNHLVTPKIDSKGNIITKPILEGARKDYFDKIAKHWLPTLDTEAKKA